MNKHIGSSFDDYLKSEEMMPKIGKYYTIYFYNGDKWVRQSGEAKCLSYFRMWTNGNDEMKIEEVPVFYYKDAFLISTDCRWE